MNSRRNNRFKLRRLENFPNSSSIIEICLEVLGNFVRVLHTPQFIAEIFPEHISISFTHIIATQKKVVGCSRFLRKSENCHDYLCTLRALALYWLFISLNQEAHTNTHKPVRNHRYGI